jgi:hypothetical protein
MPEEKEQTLFKLWRVTFQESAAQLPGLAVPKMARSAGKRENSSVFSRALRVWSPVSENSYCYAMPASTKQHGFCMVACKRVWPWAVALCLGVACWGCSGVSGPRLFGRRHIATAYRPELPQFAPSLEITDPPAPPRQRPIAELGLPEPVNPSEDAMLATPPLVAHGPPERAGEAAGSLRALYRFAAQRYASTNAYVVRLHRREQVNGRSRPDEVLLFKFRKEPWSVYFKWVGEEAKDREVIYVKGQHGNLIHTLTAAGDIPLMPLAGRHIKVTPDSALLRSASRHPITDAGIGFLIESFGALLDAAERGDCQASMLKYVGVLKRSESDQPLEGVVQMIPAGAEAAVPGGGERLWFFDVGLRFPVLVITHDARGQELEYHWYETFSFPGQLSDNDFNPDLLWHR